MPKRPPKKWFYRCVKKVRARSPDVKDPAAVCANVWHHRASKSVKRKIMGEEKGNPVGFAAGAATGYAVAKHKPAVLKAIKSKRTPPRLRKGLIRYARKRGWL